MRQFIIGRSKIMKEVMMKRLTLGRTLPEVVMLGKGIYTVSKLLLSHTPG